MWNSIEQFVNLIFPKACPSCNRPLLKSEISICLHCQAKLPKRLMLKGEDLKERFYGRINLEEAHGFLLFKNKGLTQKLLHSIKYKGNQELAIDLGKRFGKECKSLNLFASLDVIIPIPLHKSKLRFRGFNQSALIAQGLASSLQIDLDEASVIKKVKTATQTKKTRMERWQNVDNTFEVVTEHLKNKHVLIVDDVITTGATLESCGQAILTAGAAKISIACLAIA